MSRVSPQYMSLPINLFQYQRKLTYLMVLENFYPHPYMFQTSLYAEVPFVSGLAITILNTFTASWCNTRTYLHNNFSPNPFLLIPQYASSMNGYKIFSSSTKKKNSKSLSSLFHDTFPPIWSHCATTEKLTYSSNTTFIDTSCYKSTIYNL